MRSSTPSRSMGGPRQLPRPTPSINTKSNTISNTNPNHTPLFCTAVFCIAHVLSHSLGVAVDYFDDLSTIHVPERNPYNNTYPRLQAGMYVFCTAVVLSLSLGVVLDHLDETHRKRLGGLQLHHYYTFIRILYCYTILLSEYYTTGILLLYYTMIHVYKHHSTSTRRTASLLYTITMLI